MRGEVEIWSGGELLLKESNMLVDGAGEVIADMLTVSPSLSALDSTTSSILDTSNYTIQSISFGTGRDAWNNNAHLLTVEEEFTNSPLGLIKPISHGPMVAAIWDYTNKGGSFIPEVGIPVAPNPSMRVLEYDTNVSANFAGSGATVGVSSVFPGNGQHTNFLPSGIASGIMESTDFSALSSMTLAAAALGAFPEGSSIAQTTQNNATYLGLFYPTMDLAGAKSANGDNYGFFNEVSSMDVSGFVNLVMSASPHDAPYLYEASSTASGLTLSSTATTFPGDSGEDHAVEYSVSLAAGDLATVNMYGGIFHLGLWAIDVNASLQNGNTPPFAFNVLNNPRKYKLFCRKTFTKNLCHINDGGGDGYKNYTDLTIKWRLHFI